MATHAHSPARPHVVAHVAVSLDGATTGFSPDVGRFYALAQTWREDATLTGADTVLAQEPALRGAAPVPAPEGAPLLAVVDGRARVREWAALRGAGHWSSVVALRAEATPPRPRPPVPEIVAGAERVDLGAALAALGERHGVRAVRVDSGGALLGALLERGLVDELSLLVHPLTAGPGERVWHGGVRPQPAGWTALAAELLDDGLVWLRYRSRSRP
ncbi:dihydrofolate reductase family protein [Streptomonospora sp. S1-112]|uniref:Dihydrofolate reductase family protein n=1 Tax=Streptomonospora mangrovi TaxID=2883123 RepID=A0A9X3SF67_9ACTN|nr:dihydrofolate reductase family protein [Streptomonospora mangrovi]MDA0565677.1 dihydrofolate reductase family protein [Streptomonospora mangrovi]